MLIQTFDFKIISDGRGSLIALEGDSVNVPFAIQRMYYVFGVEAGTKRGAHAHKQLRQLAVCVSGACRMTLDNGLGETAEVMLDSPSKGLLIERMMWHEMSDFSPDCVLAVLARPLQRKRLLPQLRRLFARGAGGGLRSTYTIRLALLPVSARNNAKRPR